MIRFVDLTEAYHKGTGSPVCAFWTRPPRDSWGMVIVTIHSMT